jgi:hypothetical protein
VLAGTLTLLSAAPSGGLTLKVTSSNPASVHVPATIYVRGGLNSFKFGVSVLQPKPAAVTVTVTNGSNSVSGMLHVVGGSGTSNSSVARGAMQHESVDRP